MIFNIKQNYPFINYTNLIFRTFVCVKKRNKKAKKGQKNKEDSKRKSKKIVKNKVCIFLL